MNIVYYLSHIVSDIAIVDKKVSSDSVIFSYLPKNVVWNLSPPVNKTRIVVCQERSFRPQGEEQTIDESSALYYSGVDVPVNVYVRKRIPSTREIHCGWLEKTKTNSWKLLHSDVIPFL